MHRVKRMKRYTAIILALLLTAAASGCQTGGKPPPEGGRISVVCTVFPQYDWALQILGDQAGSIDLTLLLNNRIDLHSYQPSVEDMLKVSSCDLFIYVGGESDKWVDGALKQAANKNMRVINLLDALGDAAKIEEALEGMEEEDEDGEEEEDEYDEHVWLSLGNARTFCYAITEALTSLDQDHAGLYTDNLRGYLEKLAALDVKYREAVGAAPVKTLLFGDRFPFRYLADDYGIDCYAAFPGCSAETEASFDTIIFLSEKVDELGLKTVMVTESSDQSVAKTVINHTADKDRQILVLDSMQSVTLTGDGTTYLSIMEGNLDVLKEALK